jgi:hypothetical protein
MQKNKLARDDIILKALSPNEKSLNPTAEPWPMLVFSYGESIGGMVPECKFPSDEATEGTSPEFQSRPSSISSGIMQQDSNVTGHVSTAKRVKRIDRLTK